MVKFDPINANFFDKENAYRDFVSEFGETEDFLFAEVELEEKDDFPKRYTMTHKEYPVLKLFNGGSTDNPITFDGDWNKENLLRWLKANSNVRFSLPSCLSSFDELAESFMESEPAKRRMLLEKAKTKGAELEGKAKASADVYIKIMQLILDRGNGFVASEEARVKNLLGGKITSAKKEELRARLNIIRSFMDPKELEAREKAEKEKAEKEKAEKEKAEKEKKEKEIAEKERAAQEAAEKGDQKEPEAKKTETEASQAEDPSKKAQEIKVEL